ncbi:hypothetical protein IWQ60_000125 [Tieghemiomyces parasiticus]|uniref:Uncharacterized protein n=1 Tax=Tieghemiomyces parasiticus TaxID=78921 RepID=A0A9W8DXW1_9FUNG|nr:hypothetical protein IWQ60_000125 [Tieghemiomyces parasiticus]
MQFHLLVAACAAIIALSATEVTAAPAHEVQALQRRSIFDSDYVKGQKQWRKNQEAANKGYATSNMANGLTQGFVSISNAIASKISGKHH